MSNFEFLEQNIVNTTTMITCTSGTTSTEYIFDRTSTKFQSDGNDTQGSANKVSFVFSPAEVISRIALTGINLKGFSVYYDSNPANLLTLTDAPTTQSEWSQNSTTNMYLKFASITVASIDIHATSTIADSKEKEITDIYIADKQIALENNPTANQYKPKYKGTQYAHSASDGGIVVYHIGSHFEGDVRLKYVGSTEQSLFYDIYTNFAPFLFIPEPTGTSWNAKIYEVNWLGDFDFEQYSNDYKGAGYSGRIKLAETPK